MCCFTVLTIFHNFYSRRALMGVCLVCFQLTRKRSDHLARLQQIKTRKAGTSSTLDNTPPECMFLDRFKSDPRKASKKKAQNNIIERENK